MPAKGSPGLTGGAVRLTKRELCQPEGYLSSQEGYSGQPERKVEKMWPLGPITSKWAY